MKKETWIIRKKRHEAESSMAFLLLWYGIAEDSSLQKQAIFTLS